MPWSGLVAAEQVSWMHQSGGDHGAVFHDFDSVIDAWASRRESAWIELRRHLHRHPEPSGEETATSELIRDHLMRQGIEARTGSRGVGVTADLCLGEAPHTGPLIALRADIDALRMSDRKNVPWASEVDGCAHACGHDVHTTVLLAAAELLHRIRGSSGVCLPPARIRLIFQAAEEICQGAQWMVDDGVMDGVDTILAIHVEPRLRAGQVGIRHGPLTAHVDELFIVLKGQGGHSARPHETSDPIAAAAGLVNLLYQHIPRMTDAREPVVLTIGQIHGGTAPNVIPDQVELGGTLRSICGRVRTEVMQKIRDCCDHVARLTGNRVDVEFRNPLGSVVNAVRPVQAFERAARRVLGDRSVVHLTAPSMGGEDFAVYLEHAPGAQVRLGCAATDHWPLLHSPVFDVDERVIAMGARLLVHAVLDLLGQDDPLEFQI